MDLSLIPVEALVEELEKRFDSIVFMGMKDVIKGPKIDKQRVYYDHWRGDHMVCAGYCNMMLAKITKFHDDCEGEDDGEH